MVDGIDWSAINDPAFYNLPEPGIGEIYIEVDGGALKIIQDTMIILEIFDGWGR